MKRVTLFLTSLVLLLTTTNLIYGKEPSDEAVAKKPPAASASKDATNSPNTLPFRAQLLLIKSDWSQGDDADAIEADWREALKDVPLSQELLDKLPTSGPEILFAPDLVKFYKIEHFQQLYRWLTQHELVEDAILFPEAELLLPPSVRKVDEYIATLSKRMDFIPLPRNPRGTNEASGEPYAQIYWDIVLSKETSRLAVVRQPVATRQKLEHGGTSSGVHGWLCSVARYVLPKGHAAITHAFPASEEGEFRDATRRAGIEPLIVVFELSPREDPRKGGKDRAPLEPRFCLPDLVETVSVQHGHEANVLGHNWLPGRVTPFITRDPKPPSSAPPSQQTASAQKVRVFHLKTADATSLATTLTQFLPEVRAIVPDRPKDALIVLGTEPHITEVASLIEQIDVGDKRETSVIDAQAGEGGVERALDAFDRNLQALDTLDSLLPTSPAMIEELRWGYESNERVASATAAELRRLLEKHDGSNTDAARAAALRGQLRQQVAESFLARQQLHDAELANLLCKLKQARETIDQRNRIKDQIIDRRVEDLLNPELRWDVVQKSTVQSTTQPAKPLTKRPEQPTDRNSATNPRSTDKLFLTVEGPSDARVGQKVQFKVELKNDGLEDQAVQISIAYDDCLLPEQATPGFAIENDRLNWRIDSLPAGGTISRLIEFECTDPQRDAEVRCTVVLPDKSELTTKALITIHESDGPVRLKGETEQADVSDQGNGEQPLEENTPADLAYDGFCPVTVVEKEKWVPGKTAYSLLYNGARYRFASQEALDTFKAKPTRYTPVMEGRDVVIAKTENRVVPGTRKHGMWFGDRIFLFESKETLEKFWKNPHHYYEFGWQKKPVPPIPSSDAIERSRD